jgi:hypothetical protein
LQVRRPVRVSGKDGIYFDHRGEYRVGAEGSAESFVSMMSYQGVPVEEIAGSAGHARSRTTEVIHRRELRPVITTGAEVMDRIFRPKQPGASTQVWRLD